MSDPTPTKRPKGRSPAYPSIDLRRAIERADQVFKKERQYSVSTSVIPGLWGYSTLNGPAAQQLSALLKFGLLESEGSRDQREVRVSDLAVQILNHPSSQERRDAVQRAALLPPVHQEMWTEYGDALPSDSNLLWRLTRERGFTETGAKEFIREWRETMEFAGLVSGAQTVSPVEDGESEPSPAGTLAAPEAHEEVAKPIGQVTKPLGQMTYAELSAQPDFEAKVASGRAFVEATLAQPPSSHLQSYPIPIALSGRPPVVISGAFPLSEAEWAQFRAVIEAMKPVLVGDTAPGSDTQVAAGE